MHGQNEGVSVRMKTYPNIFGRHCPCGQFPSVFQGELAKTNKIGKSCEIVEAAVRIFLKMCTSFSMTQINSSFI